MEAKGLCPNGDEKEGEEALPLQKVDGLREAAEEDENSDMSPLSPPIPPNAKPFESESHPSPWSKTYSSP